MIPDSGKGLARRVRDVEQTADPRVSHFLRSLANHNLQREFRIEVIAKELNISISRLRHLIKKDLGVSPIAYVKKLRLEQAREMIRSSFLSLKEIAATVGIADMSHFMREYKIAFGETPSQTRRKAGRSHDDFGTQT